MASNIKENSFLETVLNDYKETLDFSKFIHFVNGLKTNRNYLQQIVTEILYHKKYPVLATTVKEEVLKIFDYLGYEDKAFTNSVSFPMYTYRYISKDRKTMIMFFNRTKVIQVKDKETGQDVEKEYYVGIRVYDDHYNHYGMRNL